MSPAKGKSATSRKSAAKSAAKSATRSTARKATKKTVARKKATKSPKNGGGDFYDHNVEIARELSAIAESHAVSELIYETDALTLTIRRGEGSTAPIMMAAPPQMAQMTQAPMAVPAAASVPVAAAPDAAEDDSLHVVTSPFVGTFYRSPNPDAQAYVEPGQSVTKGQVLCIVEAMKLMNEIEADVAGVVKTILVKNAESVEYGQSLFKIEPA